MPSSQSSTSSSGSFAEKVIENWVSNECYEDLLINLLAFIHRDGGQYTELAGLAVSYTDAWRIVDALYKDNAALKARLKKVTNGEERKDTPPKAT